MIDTIASFRNYRHIDKTRYLVKDELFYESSYENYIPGKELSDLVSPLFEASNSTWELLNRTVWTHAHKKTNQKYFTAKQGWKIHVSATTLNCKEVLCIVAKLAIENDIEFKFANDINTLMLMTSKRWSRGGSGKFITVYPDTIEQFLFFLEACDKLLENYNGAYILSDRRYKNNRCLYYRYGGIIAKKHINCFGQETEVLTSPSGELVIDSRKPYFNLPNWVQDLFPQDEGDEESGDISLNGGKYVVQEALSFSNTGGVYLARDRNSGKSVVIKEARPGVELRINGEDATDRLIQEAKIMKIASGLSIAPEVYDTFWDWENFYLVEEYIDAYDMREIMLKYTPLLRVNPSEADSIEFYNIYIKIFIGLLEAIKKLHELGIVIGDLSPTNILIDKNSFSVRIIDFEGAFRPNHDSPQNLFTPGFRVEYKGINKESNFQDDIYAIGVIMMYSMFPIAAMAHVRTDVFSSVLSVVVKDIGWEDTSVQKVINGLISGQTSCEDAINLLKKACNIKPVTYTKKLDTQSLANTKKIVVSMSKFIKKNVRLDENKSIFPIDPFGRESNSLGFAFGDTGVIYSLMKSEIKIPKNISTHFLKKINNFNETGRPPGLLIGTAGMALALFSCGHIVPAIRLLEASNSSSFIYDHHSLYYGMSGIGMANLAGFHSTGNQKYLTKAIELGERLINKSQKDERGVFWQDQSAIRIGYGYGQSGVALFLLRLTQMTKDYKWRRIGERALQYDLSHRIELEPSVISFGENVGDKDTLHHYIEIGSSGIAKVAARYGYFDELEKLAEDAHRKYSGFPGLIYGLTGFVDILTDAHIFTKEKKYLEMAKRPIAGLNDLYIFETKGGYATPGENLFRVSCDYATGMAGIIYTLNRHATMSGDDFCLDWLDQGYA